MPFRSLTEASKLKYNPSRGMASIQVELHESREMLDVLVCERSPQVLGRTIVCGITDE